MDWLPVVNRALEDLLMRRIKNSCNVTDCLRHLKNYLYSEQNV